MCHPKLVCLPQGLCTHSWICDLSLLGGETEALATHPAISKKLHCSQKLAGGRSSLLCKGDTEAQGGIKAPQGISWGVSLGGSSQPPLEGSHAALTGE